MTNTRNQYRKKNVYILAIRGSGGFYTLGEISREAADYWVNREENDLIIHLVHPEDCDVGPTDDRFRLPDYRDSANLVSEFGFTEIEKLIVYQENREWDRTEHVLKSLRVPAVFHENQRFYGSQSCTLETRTSECGHVVYRIDTTGKFDPRKLTFTQKFLRKDFMLIDSVYYDNVLLNVWEYFENVGELHAKINIE